MNTQSYVMALAFAAACTAVGCATTPELPPGESVSSSQVMLEATQTPPPTAAMNHRDPERIDPASVPALALPPSALPARIPNSEGITFDQAFSALSSAQELDPTERRDRVFAAVEAAERLPRVQQDEAKLRIRNYLERNSLSK